MQVVASIQDVKISKNLIKILRKIAGKIHDDQPLENMLELITLLGDCSIESRQNPKKLI